MSIFERSPALRWAVPAVTAVALVAGGAAVNGLSAIADDGLPPRTAAQLLVDVQQARLDGLSGTVVQKSELGLPALPIAGSPGKAGSSDLTSLISGTHTMRVWFAGPDKARMALLGTLGESDVIRNGKDLWIWSSKDKTAKHFVLPAHDASGKSATVPDHSGMPGRTDLPTSPQEAAERALAAITPSTEVTTSGTATVAGRPAYEMVLKPKEATSLVAQVRVAVDGTEHVPLRVQVFAKSVADPVFEVAFSAVDFARPDGAQFAFKPPPGTTVTEGKSPTHAKAGSEPGAGKNKTIAPQPNSADMPKVVGKGWGSVLVAKMSVLKAMTDSTGTDTGTAAGRDVDQLMGFVALLPKVSGPWGSGHLMKGTAFSVLVTDDGRLVVGAVTPEGLFAALAAS
jgi:outer membrane lipoprotein-sorting protein